MPTLLGCDTELVGSAATVARIGGDEITLEQLESHLQSAFEGDPDALALSRLLDQFLDSQLILRLALDQGLAPADADPRRAAAFLLRGALDHSWDEATVNAYYEAHRRQFERPERIRLRQILVHERARALEARAALEAGEDFAQVAARLSQGPKAHLGGDQGWLAREDLPLSFAELITRLSPGDVSEIVATDYGFHIFQVIDRSPAAIMEFAEVEQEIHRALERRQTDELLARSLEEARRRYEVELFPDHLPFTYQGAYASQSLQ